MNAIAATKVNDDTNYLIPEHRVDVRVGSHWQRIKTDLSCETDQNLLTTTTTFNFDNDLN
jgi:hypothetical protein